MTAPDTITWLVRVVGPDFVAAFETDGSKVRVTAPILRKYIHGLFTDEACAIIAEEGCQPRSSRSNSPSPASSIIQRRKSFEVQKDGVKAFFLYDDVASRRAINGRCDKETALIKAQGYLAEAH